MILNFEMLVNIFFFVLLSNIELTFQKSFDTLDQIIRFKAFKNEKITINKTPIPNNNEKLYYKINKLHQMYSTFEIYDVYDAIRNCENIPVNNEPDFSWDAKQMIEFRGFKFEAHNVITEDCYILSLHRIVNPFNSLDKPPVLLQHGLIDSSTGWLLNSIGGNINDHDDRNLAFALAKRNYDVWLGNFRGNIYSKNHTTFSIKDSNFWKFTFDNHALQDLPAQIAYIQEKTNYDQIGYVGFSQGTLTMFQLLSMKPKVARAIQPYIALAPVAYLSNMESPLKYLANSKFIMRILLHRNIQFLPNSLFSKIFSTIACRKFPSIICENFVYLLSGFSDRQLNSTRMPVYFNHLPSGTSLANIVHYGLNYKSEKVQFLDYMTLTQNLQCYNSSTPPLIPLDKIQHKDMFLISALNDLLASPKDVESLKKQLKVKFTEKIIELKQFNHMDFILSTKADYYVNDYIIKVFNDKKPAQKVGASVRLRLKKYDESTCTIQNQRTRCHMDLERTLNRIL